MEISGLHGKKMENMENTYLQIGRFSSATWLITREYMLQEVNYLRKRQVSVK